MQTSASWSQLETLLIIKYFTAGRGGQVDELTHYGLKGVVAIEAIKKENFFPLSKNFSLCTAVN